MDLNRASDVSENCAARDFSQETNSEMMENCLSEVEEQQRLEEKEQRITEEEEELRRRQKQAENKCKELKERHEDLYEHGLIIEELILEMEAEKKSLTCKIKDFQGQVDNIRKKRREEEEASKEEEQYVYIRMLEKWIKMLREKNYDLEAKIKLKEIQETLRRKDEEINEKCWSLNDKIKKIEELFSIIEDLRQEKRNLQEELSSKEEQKLELMFEATKDNSTKTQDEKHKDERLLWTKSWWDYTKGLWSGVKAAGVLALCVCLPVTVMAVMAPVCNCQDPDCSLWNIAYDLLDSYSQLHHSHPSLY